MRLRLSEWLNHSCGDEGINQQMQRLLGAVPKPARVFHAQEKELTGIEKVMGEEIPRPSTKLDTNSLYVAGLDRIPRHVKTWICDSAEQSS